MIFPSIFDIYTIRDINESNCEAIRRILSQALCKPLGLYKKLKLQFTGNLNDIMKDVLCKYKEIIICLDIEVFGDEEFLIEPNLEFNLLESLSVWFRRSQFAGHKTILESLLAKHAHQLKDLRVRRICDKGLGNIIVPLLPNLDCLALHNVSIAESTSSFLEACRETVTSLDIRYTTIDVHPHINYFPNLSNLTIWSGDSLDLLIHNAKNLISLTLMRADIPMELPELPKLRELNISSKELLPLLTKCRETLECLLYSGDTSSNDFKDFLMTLPRLTGLYLLEMEIPSVLTDLLKQSSCLEFLYVEELKKLPVYSDGFKMEQMRTVVIKFRNDYAHDFTPEQTKHVIAQVCPNFRDIIIFDAENKVEANEITKSCCRKKGYLNHYQSFRLDLYMANFDTCSYGFFVQSQKPRVLPYSKHTRQISTLN